MPLLPIIEVPDPILRAPSAPVERVDGELQRLIADMFETMYEARGVGLAAPQVHVSKRLFVMDCSGGSDPAQRVALVNPEVLTVEGAQTGDEGCLSFPGVFFPVKRSLRVVVRAQDVRGETFELDGMDLTARCMLHETDHCDGIVFIDHTTVLKREMVKRKMRKLARMAKM